MARIGQKAMEMAREEGLKVGMLRQTQFRLTFPNMMPRQPSLKYIQTVSYTHLDVYKRQTVSGICCVPMLSFSYK